MGKNILIAAVFLLGAFCALIFVVQRPSSVSASRADSTPSTRQPNSSPKNTNPAAPIQVPNQAIPLAPGAQGLPRETAAGMADPRGRGKRNAGLDDPSKSDQEKARSMYESFVNRGDLNRVQRDRFDQIIQDIWHMKVERSRRLAQQGNPADPDGDPTIDQEAYMRLKSILTPAQYEVFKDEIGWEFPYVIAFALPHPNF